MGIDLQDAEFILPCQCPDLTRSTAVIPADHKRQLVVFQVLKSGLLQGEGEIFTGLVDRTDQLLNMPVFIYITPIFQKTDYLFCLQPDLLVGRDDGRIDLLHGHPCFPGTGYQGIVEVDLERTGENVPRPLCSSFCIGYGNIPRHGDEHQPGFLHLERQTENVVVFISHSAGVKLCTFFFCVHAMPLFVE